MKVLVVEDDINLQQGLRQILEGEGYEVTCASDGAQGLEVFPKLKPDLVCLDVMMPGKSGYEVCKAIRKTDEHVPVIFITAKSEEIDRVLGLELGADDYILKPFGAREVAARVRAVTRRFLRAGKTSSEMPEVFEMGELEIRSQELRAVTSGRSIDLSLRETKILHLLWTNAGKVVDRELLLNTCWGQSYLPNSRTLEQTISNLRKKVEPDPQTPSVIRTVHGAGYRYEPKGKG